MGATPIQLADAFGLVVDSRDTMGDHSLFAQTVHTLQQAVQPGKHPDFSWHVPAQDYKQVKSSVTDIPRVFKFTVFGFIFMELNYFLLSSSLLMHGVCRWSLALKRRKFSTVTTWQAGECEHKLTESRFLWALSSSCKIITITE